ncbi:MAG: GerMN domain-containing protein [Clostridia bacterium]|nr:GerMN domain-containing protein [Clostridia bacterium]
MKNKKIIMYVSIILIVIILMCFGYFIFNNIKNKKGKDLNEYIPEEEITEEQLRQTVVTLYFLDPETLELKPETRKIDSKLLINYPYEILINLLIEGPKNEKLLKLIPENTKLLGTEIKNNILYINLSKEFIDEQNLGKQQEELIVKSIVNTVTELTEINKIAILIEGEEAKAFPDNELKFNNIFIRN